MGEPSTYEFELLAKYTEFCPNDSNILLFNGKPEKVITDGHYGAYCRKCRKYFKIPLKK